MDINSDKLSVLGEYSRVRSVLSTWMDRNPFSEIINTLYYGRFGEFLEENSQVLSSDGRSTG